MAEKKIKTIKKADGSTTTATVAQAKPVGNATPFRIGAVIAWIAAIAFEVVALLVVVGKLEITFMNSLAFMIIALVLDLACVITGSLLWKKANHIDPASEANKVKFWLWNNMGLIVCAFAFIPFVIVALTNKNADKKTKTIATVVAVIALLIGSLFSIEWNPISAEEKEAAMEQLGETSVYWSNFGHVYHTTPDCSHLNQSDELTEGNVEQAIAAGRTRMCKTCEARGDVVIEDKGEDTAEVTDEVTEAAA